MCFERRSSRVAPLALPPGWRSKQLAKPSPADLQAHRAGMETQYPLILEHSLCQIAPLKRHTVRSLSDLQVGKHMCKRCRRLRSPSVEADPDLAGLFPAAVLSGIGEIMAPVSVPHEHQRSAGMAFLMHLGTHKGSFSGQVGY